MANEKQFICRRNAPANEKLTHNFGAFG